MTLQILAATVKMLVSDVKVLIQSQDQLLDLAKIDMHVFTECVVIVVTMLFKQLRWLCSTMVASFSCISSVQNSKGVAGVTHTSFI